MSFNNWVQESIFFPGQGKIREFVVGQGNFLDRTSKVMEFYQSGN